MPVGKKKKPTKKLLMLTLTDTRLAEPGLFAKDASFGRALEALFTEYRNAIKQGSGARGDR